MILIVWGAFQIILYKRIVPNRHDKHVDVSFSIYGVSNDEMIRLYLDKKLVQRYMGEVDEGKLRCSPGNHNVAFRRDDQVSAIDAHISESLRLDVYVDDVGIEIISAYVAEVQKNVEEMKKEFMSGIKTWLVSVFIASLFMFLATVRILANANMI